MRRRLMMGALTAAPVLLVAASARADWLTDIAQPFEDALTAGNWALALFLVYVAGLVTSLTPCVYPMIAITVSVFGASEAKTKLHAAGLSTMYVLGIVVLFTGLGLVFGLLQLDNASIYGNAWFWVAIATLLLVLSLAMFGAYELRLPSSLQNKLAQMGGIGPKGAFVLGLAGGLIATPCTGPVLGGLLLWIGTTGNAVFGAAALAAFALGLGTLTWVVGTFAVSLPKSGPWMEGVKSVLGLILVATALFFLFNSAFPAVGHALVQKTSAHIIGAIVLLVVGIGVGAVHLSYHDTSAAMKVRKTLGLVLTSAGALGVVLWLNTAPPTTDHGWMDDYDAARALADTENRPLIVDFGASWCGACQELERETFSDPRVEEEGRRFIRVRVDLSPGQDVERGQELLAQYNQRGLPLVVVHDSEGEEVDRVTSFIEPERMLQIMQAAD